MFCDKCGNEIPDGSVYCNYCGEKVVNEEDSSLIGAEQNREEIPMAIPIVEEEETKETKEQSLDDIPEAIPVSEDIEQNDVGQELAGKISEDSSVIEDEVQADIDEKTTEAILEENSTGGENEQDEPVNNMTGVFKKKAPYKSLAKEDIANKIKPAISKFKFTKKKLIILGVAAFAVIFAILFGTKTLCFHDWEEATCTKAKTCTKCGRIKGEPLGHDFKKATCTKPKTCKKCGWKEGKALGHSVSTWEIVEEATCDKAGSRKGTCSRCKEEITETIEQLGHDWDEWQDSPKATCSEDGLKVRTCKRCNAQEKETVSKLGHDWSDWETIENATMSHAGSRQRTCKRCKETEKEVIPLDSATVQKDLSNHLNIPVKEFVAYCEKNGYKVQYRIMGYENRYSDEGYWEQIPPDATPDPLPDYKSLIEYGFNEGGDEYGDLTSTIWALKISSVDVSSKTVVVWINLNSTEIDRYIQDLALDKANEKITVKLYEGGVEE